MKKFAKVALIVIFVLPMLICGLSTLGIFSSTSNSKLNTLSPAVETPMGGGGQNSLTDPIKPNYPQISDDNDDVEIKEYSVTYKKYEDYFTDLNISQTTITEADLTGSGTDADPYVVHSTKGFLYLSNYTLAGSLVSKTVELDCDVVLNDEKFDANGKPSEGDGIVYSWQPISGGNKTKIYGNGYSIKGLYVNLPEEFDYVGLFAYQSTVGEVDSVRFENFYCNGKHSSALGYNATKVSNVEVVNSYFIGITYSAGIAIQGKYVYNCKNYSNATSLSRAAGICISITEIKNSKNYGTIIGGASQSAGIAALGQGKQVKFIECENYGDVYADNYAAGIIAYISSDMNVYISHCTNYGKICQASVIGGIVAQSRGNINISYSANYGEIKIAANSGAIIGSLYSTGASYPVLSVVQYCKMQACSEVPFIKDAFALNNGSVEIKIENIEINYSNVSKSCYFILNKVGENVSAQINKVVLNLDNVTAKYYLFNTMNKTSKIDINNVLVQKDKESTATTNNKFLCAGTIYAGMSFDSIIDANRKVYYGSNFKNFIVIWKTGEITMKTYHATSFFQSEIDEEWLINKKFEKGEL